MTVTKPPPIKLAILISGGGRTMVNIAGAINAGNLNAEIAIVIASRPNLAGLDRARELDLHAKTIARKQYKTPAEFSDVVFDEIRAAGADLVCMAGFLSLLVIPDDYENRVINIHPALLPDFGGKGMFGHHVHEAVLAAGKTVSGCTVHYADNQYDHGRIILQRQCEVKPGDTPDDLAARIFEQECIAYPEAIRQLIGARQTT